MSTRIITKKIKIPAQPARIEEMRMIHCNVCGEDRPYLGEDRCTFCIRCKYGDKPYH